MVNDLALEAIERLYGPLPPRPGHLAVRVTHQLMQPTHELSQWQLSAAPGLHWTLRLAWPLNQDSAPLLLSPDGCWPQVIHTGSLHAVLQEGVALAWFDRVELAFDSPEGGREGPVHAHWPERPWSAVAVWAWGLIQTARALRERLGPRLPGIGLVGHSRGGKAALVAGALDAQIEAVVSHNSGTGGASSLQQIPEGAETLAALAQRFPHWLAPEAARPEVQQALVEADAPFHWLRAIAPRGLCLLQAQDDAWANPAGTERMLQRLQAAWTEQPERLQGHTRSGGHAMTLQDWQRAAAFVRAVVETQGSGSG